MDRSRFPLRLSQWTRRFLVKGAVWREEDRTPSSSSLVLSLEPALSRVSDWRGSWGGGGGAHRSAPSHKDSRGNVSGLLAGGPPAIRAGRGSGKHGLALPGESRHGPGRRPGRSGARDVLVVGHSPQRDPHFPGSDKDRPGRGGGRGRPVGADTTRESAEADKALSKLRPPEHSSTHDTAALCSFRLSWPHSRAAGSDT